MLTREEVTAGIRTRFANVKERGHVLGRALKERAAIAATRRRLQTTYAGLGEHVYEAIKAGQAWDRGADPELASFDDRIKGIKAELRQRETALKEILEGPVETPDPVGDGGEPEAGKKKEAKAASKASTGSARG